jgi:hypothetical protein
LWRRRVSTMVHTSAWCSWCSPSSPTSRRRPRLARVRPVAARRSGDLASPHRHSLLVLVHHGPDSIPRASIFSICRFNSLQRRSQVLTRRGPAGGRSIPRTGDRRACQDDEGRLQFGAPFSFSATWAWWRAWPGSGVVPACQHLDRAAPLLLPGLPPPDPQRPARRRGGVRVLSGEGARGPAAGRRARPVAEEPGGAARVGLEGALMARCRGGPGACPLTR